MLDEFIQKMEAVFGKDSCNVLNVRPVGPATLEAE